MKRIVLLASLNFSSVAAASDIQWSFETFHSYQRMTATQYLSGWHERRETYNNAAGAGVRVLYPFVENFDLGLALGYVRYYEGLGRVLDRGSSQVFARYSWWHSDFWRLYTSGGISREQLHADMPKSSNFHSSYDPLFNYNLGLGGTLSFGRSSFGLEYRYADSFRQGRASITYPFLILTSPAGEPQVAKQKLKDIAVQTHELALTAQFSL